MIQGLDAQRPWLLKEPRLCLLVRELLPLLTRPVFVHVVRDPLGVAASLAARDGMTHAEALALWETYTHAAFAASRGWPRVLVDYDALLIDPLAVAEHLQRELAALGVTGLHAVDPAQVRDWIEPPRARDHAATRNDLSASQQALHAAIADRSILAEAAGMPGPTARGS